jgi:hypothetical protein
MPVSGVDVRLVLDRPSYDTGGTGSEAVPGVAGLFRVLPGARAGLCCSPLFRKPASPRPRCQPRG